MRLTAFFPHSLALRLLASVLVPVLAVAGVAEQACLCVEEPAEGAHDEHSHGDHTAPLEGDHGDGEAAHGHQHSSDSGHGECTCARIEVALAELSQPVSLDAQVPLGVVPAALPPSSILSNWLAAGVPQAREARSEHPPPLFLIHCSWRC